MSETVIQLSREDIINGAHERCEWCRKVFRWVDGKFERFKALDGNFYCTEAHSSAPYLTPRSYTGC